MNTILLELLDKKHITTLRTFYRGDKNDQGQEVGAVQSFADLTEKLRDDPCGYPHITAFVSDVRVIALNTYKRSGPNGESAQQAQFIEKLLDQKIGMLSSSMREQAS